MMFCFVDITVKLAQTPFFYMRLVATGSHSSLLAFSPRDPSAVSSLFIDNYLLLLFCFHALILSLNHFGISMTQVFGLAGHNIKHPGVATVSLEMWEAS